MTTPLPPFVDEMLPMIAVTPGMAALIHRIRWDFWSDAERAAVRRFCVTHNIELAECGMGYLASKRAVAVGNN